MKCQKRKGGCPYTHWFAPLPPSRGSSPLTAYWGIAHYQFSIIVRSLRYLLILLLRANTIKDCLRGIAVLADFAPKGEYH